MPERQISFEVDGVHGWMRAGHNHERSYMPAREREWQNKIRAAWEKIGSPEFEGVISVSILVFKLHPYTKPDADNIAKSVLDALNGCAWKDDNAVTNLWVHKEGRHLRGRDSTAVIIEGELLNADEYFPELADEGVDFDA